MQPSEKIVRIVLIIITVGIDIAVFFFVHPDVLISVAGELFVVGAVILWQGFIVYLVTSLFLSTRDHVLITIGLVVFLFLTYYFGFQILNTILLLLFIITLRILFRPEKS
jgi:hypothetical protein